MAQIIGDPLFPVINDDLLQGTVGNDYIYGAAGNDTLIGGAGVDTFDGGTGANDVISFADAMLGVSINLFAVDPGNTVKTVFSFDETNAPSLFGFEGVTTATIVADPAGGSNMVAKVIKANDAGASAGTTIGYSYGASPSDLGLATPIDFTAASTTMTMRVFIAAPEAGIRVRLKVEDQSDVGATTEVDAFTTGATGWQTLTFDFANEATNNGNATRLLNLADTHNKITVFFNFGVDGAGGGGGTYYFDDLKFIETPGPQGTISNDGYGNVETVQNVENVIGSAFGDSITGGVEANRLDGGDGNDSIDGGSGNDTLVGGLGNDVLIGGAGVDAIDGGAGSDTVSFTGASQGADVVLRSGASTTDVVTFEETAAPTLQVFGPDNNAALVTASIAADPEGGGNHVGKFIKAVGAEVWAGVVVSTIGTGSGANVGTLPFTATDHTMTMRVWSAEAGTDVLVKLEDVADASHNVGATATTTVAGGWETLTFNFGDALPGPGTGALNLSYTYNKAVVFFNFGDNTATGDGTFYFDDLKFLGTAVSSVNDDGYGNVDTITNVEHLIGSAFADHLTGDGQNNSLSGAAGNDTLSGGIGNDSLDGGSGNDSLDGGTGNDSMVGGEGNDSYIVDSATDKAVEASGGGTNDIVTSSVTYTLGGEVEKLTLTGSSALNGTGNTLANTITGNTGANLLVGGGGNDTISGGAGNDSLDGGTGNDSLVGSTGNDSYTVDSSTDVISETTTLATEIDSVTASASFTLGSNLEKLTLTGSAAINGTGNTLANTITGNTGANLLVGGSGNDTISGGSGNDSLDGGTGNDSLVGSTGNDSYTVDSSTDVISETTTVVTEIDSVTSSVAWTLGSYLENLTLTGSTAINGTGNTLANTLTGNTGNNLLFGNSGNDTISGGAGNDSLDGGTGNDSLVGSTGNDSYTVDSSTDVISETTTVVTEIDSVTSSVAWTLGSYLENLTLTGSSSVAGAGNTLANTLTGNTGNNLLFGNSGNDTISGGAGNDSLDGGTGNDLLVGGTGNDIYTVDSAGDIVSETSTVATEIDSVSSSVNLVLGSNLEKLTLTGSAAINGTGNSLANTITGNTGSNMLSGRAGNDTLIGDAGNDSLDGGTGNDSMAGGTGNDSYTVDSSSDLISETSTLATEIDGVFASATFTLGTNLEFLSLTGAAAINGTGNALNNTITGNTGANVLSGMGGNDVLTGGEGADTFRFASTVNGTTNVDVITDFVKGEDRIELENGVFTKFTTTGVLSAANFVASSTGVAVDSNDYVLYQTDTGKLFYDADGSGSGASVLIATLSGAPALANTDIFLT